jgi:hypothetical protein
MVEYTSPLSIVILLPLTLNLLLFGPCAAHFPTVISSPIAAVHFRVGFGDITAASVPECWLTVVFMMSGLAMFASILSSLSNIVQQSFRQTRKSAAVRNKLTEVQRWMNQQRLDVHARSKILRFYAEDWGQLHDEDPSVLGTFPAWSPVAIQKPTLYSVLSQSQGAVALAFPAWYLLASREIALR